MSRAKPPNGTKPERRTIVRPARFNAAEWGEVKARAAVAGMRPSTFLREAAKAAQVIQVQPRRVSRADRAVHELSRIGNNLNQLSRAANASGRFAMEAQLREVLEEVLTIIRSIR